MSWNVSQESLTRLGEIEKKLEAARKAVSTLEAEAKTLMREEKYPQLSSVSRGRKFKLFDDRCIFGPTNNVYCKLDKCIPPKDDEKAEYPYGFNVVVVDGNAVGCLAYIATDRYLIPVL